MRRVVRTLAVAGIASGLTVAVGASPAGAAVTASTSGTVVTVTVTGAAQVGFSCGSGGTLFAAAVAANPAIACSAVTSVIINGDGSPQTVLASDLDAAAFAANPSISASLGAGADRLSETDRADAIDMGADSDTLFIQAGGSANGVVTMGSGNADAAYFDGTPDSDTIVATSSNANASVSVSNENGGATRSAQNVDLLYLRGGDGDDAISATGVSGASTIVSVTMIGGAGDDTLNPGVKGGDSLGSEGTNTFNAGPAQDQFISYSETDVINSGSAGPDALVDMFNGRSGSRTINGSALWRYTQFQDGCDAQARVRPDAGGGSRVVSSLCRPGIQALPSTVARIAVVLDDPVRNKGLADVVIPGSQSVAVNGDRFGDDLLDVTVPTGSWSTVNNGTAGFTIAPTDAWGDVLYKDITNVSVHGPWTDKNQGFAHRMIRDLLFRFPAVGERNAIATALTGGTKTRAQVVAATMDTDEYRGNDVDRVFVRFLGRRPDPSGRAYWINALRTGRSLQTFRAQLFGSNEYFAKSLSTNVNFVRDAYFDVLGRLPDPAGQAYWVNKIDTGTGRGSVANAFLASTEARRAIVKDQFQRLALRLPTAAEADHWVQILATPTGELTLIQSLAAGATYYNAS